MEGLMNIKERLLMDNTPPIQPDLLCFGIGVFQAALAGELVGTADLEPGEALAHMGLHAIEQQIQGHGLTPEEELSLMFRVVAFPPLLEQAASDERTAAHVRQMETGYEVSEPFLNAAARCRLQPTHQGTFRYDLENLASLLVN